MTYGKGQGGFERTRKGWRGPGWGVKRAMDGWRRPGKGNEVHVGLERAMERVVRSSEG